MKVEIITPPASLPISFPQVVNHLRLPPGYDDKDYVTMTMQDAVDYFQDITESSLVEQTLRATYFDNVLNSKYVLPRGPVVSITSITANNITVDPTLYTLKRKGNCDYVEFKNQPPTPIVITYVAGYATVPNTVRRGLLVHISHLYQYRESTTTHTANEVPNSLSSIYDNYKRTSRIN